MLTHWPAYCEAWTTWKGATQKIRQFGMVVKNKQDGDLPIISPYVKIAHNAMSQMRALLVEFGMTPSSRVRIQVQPGRRRTRGKQVGWGSAMKAGSASARAIRLVNNLTHTKGPFARQPFDLRPWQVKDLCGNYSRRGRTACASTGRAS